MASTKSRWKALLLAVLCGAAPLATSATCDPGSGAFSFFRDGGGYYDGGYYNDYYYDDYYYDDYYYGDCLFGFDCF